MKSKRSLFLILLLIILLLTGCVAGERNLSQASEVKQELKVNLTSEPFSLHPGLATDSTSFTVLQQIFEGLTRIGLNNKPEPAMAKQIAISNDRKTYTFTLRDATWTNGDPVTAHDFEYAWKWVLDPKNESQYAYQLYYIKNASKANAGDVPLNEIGVKAIDAKTLQVQLEHATPYFLELTAFATYFPVNSTFVKANPNWYTDADTYITNGPFTMTRWDHNDQIIVEKNEEYWDSHDVKLDRIKMVMINDSNTELNMFKNGELDWAGSPSGGLPTEAIPFLENDGKLQVKAVAGTYWYKFQTEKEPLNNVNIRKALAYAINRQEIVTYITQGGQIPAMAVVPPSMIAGNEQGYFSDHDLDKAQQLLQKGLKELGYSSVEELPPIAISYNTDESHAKIAQAIQQMWEKGLGVKTEMNNAEWAVFIDQLHQGDYQVGRMGWQGDFNDPINFLELFKENGGNNDTRWTNEQFRALLDKSQLEKDPDTRLALLKQAEEILMNEMPVAPIYFYTNLYVKDPRLKGAHVSGLGNVQYKWAYFE